MPNINIDDAYILNETGAEVDKVTGLFTKNENATMGEKQMARLNIAAGGSNNNLLDNWYFVGGGSQLGDDIFPINQRGQTSYQRRGIDRWTSDQTLTVSSNGVTTSAGAMYQIATEAFTNSLLGKTLTASVLLSDGTIHSGTAAFPSQRPAREQMVQFLSNGVVTLQTYLPPNGASQLLRVNTRSTVAAVKLEIGAYSTLANDVPPNYAEELEKCKYYCRVVDFDTDVSVGIGWAFSNSGAVIPNIFGFGNEMRAVPTVTSTGSFVLRTTSGSNINVISFAIGASVKDAISLNASVASGLTANQPVRLQAGTGAKLVFSAEL